MPLTRRTIITTGAVSGVAVVTAVAIGMGVVAQQPSRAIPATPAPLITESLPDESPVAAAPASDVINPADLPSPSPSTSSRPSPTPRAPLGGATKAPFATPASVKATVARASTVAPAAPPAKATLRYVSSITPVSGGVTIKDGWNGTRVYVVRQHFGLDAPTSKGGTYDAATKAKVTEFQQQHGLPATGYVDQATWDALGTGYPFTADAFQEKPQLPTTAGASERTETMIGYALKQRGSRYTWGGAGPYTLGYDCSGLILQALYASGYDPQPITVVKHAEPTYRTSQQLYAHGSFQSVQIEQRQRGDLIFFGNKAGVVHHVAIYLGDGTMMEAYGATAGIRGVTESYGASHLAPNLKRPF